MPATAPSAPGPPSLEGRSVWTLLFTDIVGSTEHLARLGDRGWRDLLERHDALVEDKAREFGGLVAGRTGDGFFIAFSTPAAAIRCAEAVCAAVGELGVKIRAGVHSGECEVLGDTPVGLAVHIAARVSDLAGPSEVLVTSTVRELGIGSGLELVSRGSHALRGVPGEWRLFALESETLGAPAPSGVAAPPKVEPAPSIPLPPRIAVATRGEVFGRARELERCAASFDRARARERQAVLLAGEPGIGKTRLAAEAAAAAHRDGAVVLYGRCDEQLGIPYQPFVEALDHYARHAQASLLKSQISGYGAELGRLLPALAHQPVAEVRPRWPEGDHFLLFAGVAELLGAIAARAPLVLVLDDLHWAEKPTLLLLRYLLGAPAPQRMLTIGTYRSTDLPRAHPLTELLADLRREPGVGRVTLAGLDEHGVARMAAALAGSGLFPEGSKLLRSLRRETAGNPFFVAEIVRQLAEHVRPEGPAPAAEPDEAVLRLALPSSVRETIVDRVGRLGERVKRVLTAAAVIGPDVDAQLLATVLGEDETELPDTLDAAVEASLLAPPPGPGGAYVFVHTLVQQSLYEELPPAKRRRMHRRVLEALERTGGPDPGPRIGELAQHAVNAGDPATALAYAQRAGEGALEQLAADDAVRWYRRALSLHEGHPAGGEPHRCELLIGLGTAQVRSGDPDFRDTLLEASELARRLGDTDRLARAALANTRGFASATGVVDTERVAVLEAAVQAVGLRRSPERARLLATLASELTYAGDWRRRKALTDEALAIARELGDAETLGDVLGSSFITIWTPETLEERRANTREELEIADRAGDALARFRALHWRAVVCVESGDIEGAVKLVDREAELADRLRQPTATWLAAYDRATQALMRGLPGEAEAWAERAGQIATDSGQPEALAFYVGQLVNIRFEQGRLGELEPLIAQQVDDNPGIPAFRAALALARCEAGHDEQAREILAIDSAHGFSSFPYDSNWLVGLVIYAETCGRVGDAGAAAHLYRLLEPWHDQVAFNSATTWGSLERHLGNLEAALGRLERADQRLRRAAELHERMGAPLWLARTRLDLGRLMISLGRDPAEARALLQEARATARDLGAATIERRANELLEGDQA